MEDLDEENEISKIKNKKRVNKLKSLK